MAWKVKNKKTGHVVKGSRKAVKARAQGIARHMNKLTCSRSFKVVRA